MTGYIFMGSNPAIFIFAPPLKEGINPYREDFALFCVLKPMLQIRRGNRDNLGIINYISP